MVEPNSDDSYVYAGNELDIFKHALNWKSYIRSVISYAIQGKVLEVGAGLGGTTRVLKKEEHTSWVALEPDPKLANQLRNNISVEKVLEGVQVKEGTIKELATNDIFDTILYIDVLEHIEHDAQELTKAAFHLNQGGKLVILSPAHNVFYSEFDSAIGHFRRYNRNLLVDLEPEGVVCDKMVYLDMFGMFASLANRFLLKQSMPTLRQILFWDRWLVPLSRLFDRFFFHRIGKTIVVIWQKV